MLGYKKLWWRLLRGIETMPLATTIQGYLGKVSLDTAQSFCAPLRPILDFQDRIYKICLQNLRIEKHINLNVTFRVNEWVMRHSG
jgi:hypothetical protein